MNGTEKIGNNLINYKRRNGESLFGEKSKKSRYLLK